MGGRFFLALLVLSGLALPVLFTPSPALCEDTLTDGCVGTVGQDQVVVYYFHRKFRCQSCEVLESVLPCTVREEYPLLLEDGEIAMCVVDIDDSANSHFMDDFDLISNAVVLVEKKDGKVLRFRNIENIWPVSEDRDALNQLLKREIALFMSGT